VTRSLNVTPKTTKQHLIARSDKLVAYVPNNKRLPSTFCATEPKYWQNIVLPHCDSRATSCLCGPAVSVRLSVCLSRSWILKHIF